MGNDFSSNKGFHNTFVHIPKKTKKSVQMILMYQQFFIYQIIFQNIEILAETKKVNVCILKFLEMRKNVVKGLFKETLVSKFCLSNHCKVKIFHSYFFFLKCQEKHNFSCTYNSEILKT